MATDEISEDVEIKTNSSGTRVSFQFCMCELVLTGFRGHIFTLVPDADLSFLDGHRLSHECDPVWVGFAV